MGRWTDLAQWVGPTPNQSGPMIEQRGMVLHVMQGSLAGSINWGKNPASGVSFHFGTSKAGLCQQLVDTDVTAWTQGAGNGRWVSVENEDYSGNPLSSAQVAVVAQLYARGVREYGWPYQLADSPSGRGLGWHGMGGAAWGNHPDCPGQPIKDQRPVILDLARAINGGVVPPGDEGNDDVSATLFNETKSKTPFLVWTTPDGVVFKAITTPEEKAGWVAQLGQPIEIPDISRVGTEVKAASNARWTKLAEVLAANSGGGGGGATPAQVRAAVRTELDATKLGPIG